MKMISLFRCIIIFYLSLLVSSRNTGVNKDVIGFPEYEENPLLANKQNRNPVYLPSTCPENELYYPGDQTDDWICDCRPGFLFHPDTDKCWLAYQRGPCPAEQYLVLPNDSMIPVCVPNPCKTDSTVLWKGQCQPLGASVCGDKFPAEVLWVNATTLAVDCVKVYVNNRFSLDADFETSTTCPLGGRRNVQNKCSHRSRRMAGDFVYSRKKGRKTPTNSTNPRHVGTLSKDSDIVSQFIYRVQLILVNNIFNFF